MNHFNQLVMSILEKSELQKGVGVEKEHKGTLRKIKRSIRRNKVTLSDRQVFTNIAKDHLKELPDYYTRLKKMERTVPEK